MDCRATISFDTTRDMCECGCTVPYHIHSTTMVYIGKKRFNLFKRKRDLMAMSFNYTSIAEKERKKIANDRNLLSKWKWYCVCGSTNDTYTHARTLAHTLYTSRRWVDEKYPPKTVSIKCMHGMCCWTIAALLKVTPSIRYIMGSSLSLSMDENVLAELR